jgi:RNA polymerase sigma factor (sigma-70 family)
LTPHPLPGSPEPPPAIEATPLARSLPDSQPPCRTTDAVGPRDRDALVVAYEPLIRGYARRFRLQPHDLDDVVQEACLEVTKRLDDFQFQEKASGLRSWLYRIVRAKAIDLIRRQARCRVLALDHVVGDEQEPACWEAEPTTVLERHGREALGRDLVERLRRESSELSFRVFVMRILEERSVDETAATLDLSSEQVWYRQYRQVRRLRALAQLYTDEAIGDSPPGEAGRGPKGRRLAA